MFTLFCVHFLLGCFVHACPNGRPQLKTYQSFDNQTCTMSNQVCAIWRNYSLRFSSLSTDLSSAVYGSFTRRPSAREPFPCGVRFFFWTLTHHAFFGLYPYVLSCSSSSPFGNRSSSVIRPPGSPPAVTVGGCRGSLTSSYNPVLYRFRTWSCSSRR